MSSAKPSDFVLLSSPAAALKWARKKPLSLPTGSAALAGQPEGFEDGLGLHDDPTGDNEISGSNFIQIAVPKGFINIQFSMGSTTQGEVWTVMGAQSTGLMTAFTDLGVAFDQIADEGLPHTLPDGFNDFFYTSAPADNGMNDGHNRGDGCGGNVLLASFTG